MNVKKITHASMEIAKTQMALSCVCARKDTNFRKMKQHASILMSVMIERVINVVIIVQTLPAGK